MPVPMLTGSRRRGRRRRLPAAAVCLCALVTAPSGAHAATSEPVDRRLGSMGTELRVVVEAPQRSVALAASESAIRALEEAERRLSTWRPASELQAVNAAPVGQPLRVSPRLAHELATALDCAAATGGGFDPTLAALVETWGLRQGGRLPGPKAIAEALDRTGYSALRVDGDLVTRLADVRIDEGAFGKGAGLDAAAAALVDHDLTAGHLDLGGQLRLVAPPAGPQTETVVALAHPDGRQSPVLRLRLPAGSLSTSANGERGALVDGVRVGHLLDPRSGRPAEDFGSVTVWVAEESDAGLHADCLSTGLFVLGADAAVRYAEGRPGVGVVVLERVGAGLRARVSGDLATRVVEVAPGIEIVGTAPARAVEEWEAEDQETAGLTDGNPGPPLLRHPNGAATPPRH